VGAVLSMTVPLTLVVTALALQAEGWINWEPLSRSGQWVRDSVFTFLWAAILTVQLLGLMFTFSRGPWGGAILALAMFLFLVLISFGWRLSIRVILVLGLAGLLTISFLHWQGNVSIISVGPWLGIFLALLGVIGVSFTLFMIERFGRTILLLVASATAIVVVAAAIVAPSALSGRGNADGTSADPVAGSAESGELPGQLQPVVRRSEWVC
jgi:hypothetical protein